MPKLLLNFAHPALEKSRVNTRLIKNIETVENLRFHDLYEAYPDFDIDVKYEQMLLLENEIIIMHHPFYWYSAPPLVKQWIDLVLEHGWAYGAKGKRLSGKYFMNIITTGGPGEAYRRESFNRYSIREFLLPFEQTARLCNMIYLPPYLIQGTHRLTEPEIKEHSVKYRDFLSQLAEGNIQPDDLTEFDTTNNYLSEHIKK